MIRCLPLLCLTLCWMPGVAEACSVCFDATEQNRDAFIATTAFLTLLPLMLIAAGAWWIHGRLADGPAEVPRW